MDGILLEESCEILDSRRIPITASNRKEGPYPYYGANGIQDYVDDYIFDDELVLLAEDGGNFGSKKQPIAYRVSGKCWVNNHAHVLKPKDGIDVDYLCYSLMFYNTEKLVNGATRQKLTQAMMRKMLIPKRSISEQKKIVATLNTIRDSIAKQTKRIKLLDNLIKARFVEMFGDINNKQVKIAELVEQKIPTAKKDFDGDAEIKYIDISSIDNKRNIMTGFTKHKMSNAPSRAQQHVQFGDIIISTVRPNLKNVAMISLDSNNLVASSGFCVLRPKKCTPEFLMAIVCSDKFTDAMINVVTGANYPAIKNSDVLNYCVSLPSKEQQSQFSNFVTQVDKSKFALQNSIKSLMNLWYNINNMFCERTYGEA